MWASCPGRAEALAAARSVAPGPGFQAAAFQAGSVAARSLPHRARQTLVDMADLFKPAMARQWRAELARAVLVIASVALLIAGWRFAPPFVIAAAILYLLTYPMQWDGYRLLVVTESPRLWWTAIRQWSLSLWSERLIAPPSVWLSLIGACWLLLRNLSQQRAGRQLAWHRKRALWSPRPSRSTTIETTMSQTRHVRSLLSLLFATVLLSCGGGGTIRPATAGGIALRRHPPAPAPAPAPHRRPHRPRFRRWRRRRWTSAAWRRRWASISGATTAPSTAASASRSTAFRASGRCLRRSTSTRTWPIVLNGQLLQVPEQLGQMFAHGHGWRLLLSAPQPRHGRPHARRGADAVQPPCWAAGSRSGASRCRATTSAASPGCRSSSTSPTTAWSRGGTTTPRSIELTSHRLITIQIGSQLSELPNFVWTGT